MSIIAGSSFNLTCTVELSPAVDVPVTVATEWSGPAETMFLQNMVVPATMVNLTVYTSTVTVDAARNGSYTCQAVITSHEAMSASTNITIGMFSNIFFFNLAKCSFYVSSPPSSH